MTKLLGSEQLILVQFLLCTAEKRSSGEKNLLLSYQVCVLVSFEVESRKAIMFSFYSGFPDSMH